jgi:folylpolyglutamate synthase/dihydropteroate synthase
VIVTRASNPRALPPEELRQALPPDVPAVEVAAGAVEALRLAAPASRDAVTCVTGSLSLVGDALRHLGGGGDKPCPLEKGAASIQFLY